MGTSVQIGLHAKKQFERRQRISCVKVKHFKDILSNLSSSIEAGSAQRRSKRRYELYTFVIGRGIFIEMK